MERVGYRCLFIEDGINLTCVDYSQEMLGTQFYEIYDRKNKLIDKRFLNMAFSLISHDEIDELCNEFNLAVREIFGDYHFGNFSDNSQFMNYLLTKRVIV